MFNSKKLVLSLPAHEIESGAVQQISQCIGVDVLEKLVILPDVHQGYDIPIGSVALIDGYVWPGAVGVDIGCGMGSINTHHTLEELSMFNKNDRIEVFKEIQKIIPTGYSTGNGYDFKSFTNYINDKDFNTNVMSRMNISIGTLGGGKMVASSPRG